MEKTAGLVRQARRGSASAFASLYQEYYLDLYRFSLYTLKNRCLGADWQSEEGGVI